MGTRPGRIALILGGADCVWEDVGAARALVRDPVFIAVNDAGAHWEGHLDHWVTLHPEKLVGKYHHTYNRDSLSWERQRAERGYPGGYETWSRRNPGWVDYIIGHWGAGSSGLYAVTVALHLGLRAILCGVPMDARPHFAGATGAEDEDGNWAEWEQHRSKWRDKRHVIAGRVKSMSGWTRELLGAPTPAWIHGDLAA